MKAHLIPICFAGCCVLNSSATLAPAAPSIDFNRDIRPLISARCFPCHGPDQQARKRDLRLDVRAEAIEDRGGYAAIVPRDSDKSEVIARITSTEPSEVMPPAKLGHPLSPAEIDRIRQWIQEGAEYTEHWAFVKPHRPAIPKLDVGDPKLSNPIDNFITARLGAEGLTQSQQTDHYTLIRRVSLDLTGLPPTPTEVDAFVSDRNPDAYEMLVDRLLASPAFGERWARMWLDLARYADSAGYGSDPLRLNIWPYRNWVINAINRNLPYDQFTIEQLAGDLLPHPTEDQLIATAFHRNTMTNTEGGTDREEFRVAAVKDRIATTAQVWMGLTLGCAQCHSHKFDPISQEDYYRFFAVFNQTEDADRPDERPTFPVARRQGFVSVPVMRELPKDKHRQTHLLVKGNFLNPGATIEPAMLSAFAPPAGARPDRLGVAQWLVGSDNPLTARVAVNRFWGQLFGTGLVETEEDFGTQGQMPSHPELLDWLACEFSDKGWDVKRLLKTIVTSATYRQSSRLSAESLAKDPRARLLSRYPRRRLEAETVRDQALALSGLLSRKIGGPSVYPPQPDGLWRAAFNGQRTWPTSTGEDRYRRGLYTFWRRTVPYPSMATFDAPSRENCTMRRLPTNTPLQAFVTLNDPAYVEMAQSLGRRIMSEGGRFPEERAHYALKLALARRPTADQIHAVLQLHDQALAMYRKDEDSAKRMIGATLQQIRPQMVVAQLVGAAPPCAKLCFAKLVFVEGRPQPDGRDLAEQAAWTVVGNMLLNLDALLMKG
jgi:hypothetical protein